MIDRAMRVVVVLLAVVLAGSAGAEPRAIAKVAAVFSGPVNDAGWTASAYNGLVELKKKYNFELAYTENVKPADAEQVFRDYAKAGFDVVLGHGFEWAEAIEKVAKRYPKVSFVQTNGGAKDTANLYTVTFSAGEGGYFIGLAAAQASKSGKIAYVAGTSFPILGQQIKMTRQAAKDLGKTVEVLETYVGSWHGDVAKAKELASAALSGGADVLVLEADAADPGTIEAAREAAKAGKYVRVFSWVRDKHAMAPEIVVGGWEERVPVLIDMCLGRIQKGEPGGHFALGLKEGAVALNEFYGLVPADVEKMVRDKLLGYVKDPKSLPTLEVRTDL